MICKLFVRLLVAVSLAGLAIASLVPRLPFDGQYLVKAPYTFIPDSEPPLHVGGSNFVGQDRRILTASSNHLEIVPEYMPEYVPEPIVNAAVHGRVKIVERLLACGGTDVNQAASQSLWKGATALHVAILRGDTRMVKLLVAAGADPTIESKQFTSPRQLAEQHASPDIQSLLRSPPNQR